MEVLGFQGLHIFVLGLVCFTGSDAAFQQMTYGEKITNLNRLSETVNKSQILTSNGNHESVDAIYSILRNWERTLMLTARDGLQYSAANYNVSTTCMNHLNLTVTHISEQWAMRSEYMLRAILHCRQ